MDVPKGNCWKMMAFLLFTYHGAIQNEPQSSLSHTQSVSNRANHFQVFSSSCAVLEKTSRKEKSFPIGGHCGLSCGCHGRTRQDSAGHGRIWQAMAAHCSQDARLCHI